MARLSIRSFAGVGAFMLSGVLTATLSNIYGPVKILQSSDMDVSMYLPTQTSVVIACTIGTLFVLAGILGFSLRKHATESATANERIEQENNTRKLLPSIVSAFLFSIGLVISKMTLFSKIYGFLNMKLIPEGSWDPTLIMVMGGGLSVSFVSYQWVKGFNIFNVRVDGAFICYICCYRVN